MCEILPPSNAQFSTFIRCWCKATSTVLNPLEQRKRAYYWAWQSHNWFDTVLYLQFLQYPNKWWLLDPTPNSPTEVGVDKLLWDAKLDPAKQPWMSYEDICSQFTKEEEEEEEALSLWDILQVAQIQEESKETEIGDCPICAEPVEDAALYNVLLEDYTAFQNEHGLQLDDFQAYQISKGATVDQQTGSVRIDPIDPLTAAFIRKYAKEGYPKTRQLVLTFLSNPNAFIETGPVVHGACKHAYHDECIFLWGKKPQGGPRVRHPYVFAPLRIEQGKKIAVESKILKEIPQFGCPLCRQEIKNIYLQPQKELIPLALNYNFNPPNERVVGPYALRINSLVWVYRRGRYFGGTYAGEPGILIRYLHEFPNQQQQPNNYRMDCDVSGGCFEVAMLMNNMQTDIFPGAAVFDISFLETNVLPTRAAISQLFDRPLISTIRLLEQGRIENIPTYITEGIGFGDYAADEEHVAAFAPAHRQELDGILQHLTIYFTNAESRVTFEEHLQAHRRNESPLVQRSQPELSARDMWQLIMKNSGYYRHEPPIIVHPASRTKFINRALINAVNANPVLHNLTISLYALNVMLQYALAGFNLMPNLAPVIIPVLKPTFPELPNVDELVPVPLDRPITYLAHAVHKVPREEERKRKKRRVEAKAEEDVIIIE